MLHAEKPIERELKGGETHSYNIKLTTGQFLHVVADQRGIDVVVILFEPNGKKMIEVDSPNGANGAEPLWIVAETTGDYRLEIRSLENNAKAGRYEVKINELRASTSDDKFFISGKKAIAEGVFLAGERKKESHPKAIEKFEDAAGSFRQMADKKNKAYAINEIGKIYQSLNNSEKAIPYCKEAQILFEESGLKLKAAGSLLHMGLNYQNLNMTDKAQDSFKRALAIGKSIGDKKLEADSLNKIAVTYFMLGDHAQALQTFQEMLRVSKESDYKEGYIQALGNMGIVYESQQNFTRALEYFQKELKLREEWGLTKDIDITLLAIGNVYTEQGNFPMALDYYQKALSGFEKTNNQIGVAYATNNIGSVYLNSGDYDKALEYLLKAQQLKASTFLGNEPASLKNIGMVYAFLGKYAEALEYQQRALTLFQKSESQAEIAETFNGLAITYFAMGDFAKSLEFADKSAKIALQNDYPKTYWTALDQVAKSRFKLGQKKEARQALESAIRKIESLRSQVTGSENARQDFSEMVTEPFYRMVVLLIDENLDSEAFAYAERAKARIILDVLQNGKVDITKAMTAQEREQERIFRNEIVLLNKQISKEGGNRLNELKKQLQKKRLEFEDFQTRLYAAHPELKIQRGEMKPVSLSETSELISDNQTALLEFVVAEDKTFLFVLTKSANQSSVSLKVYPIEIKQKDLAERVENFRLKLANGDLDFQKQARDLFDLLLKPAAAELQSKTNLIIVPDASLWNLPFQALQSVQSRYLIEQAAVSYAPSLTALREMIRIGKTKSNKSAPTELLAFGNPIIGKETKERVKQVFMSGSLEPLPEAERLVNGLAKLYGQTRSKVFIGSEASEDKAKAESSKYRILQFATHAILNDSSPMYSHLVLSDKTSNDANEDGLLEAWEMKDLNLNADMVVLSACETARGRVSAGEGVIGMSWSLFIAGAPTTVVSQWKVESSSTTELMLEFHRQLLTGKNISKAEALRRASLKLLKSNQYKHPSFWAPFVIVGDGF